MCRKAKDSKRLRSTTRPTFATWLGLFRDKKRILDLGSGELGGFPLARGAQVTRVDIQPRFRPAAVADAQRLPFKDSSFDAVLAMSVLEHVPRPWLAVEEIRRILRSGGLVLGYVPFMYPYHADASFHDYYRFTGEALHSLFDRFDSIEIISAGGYANVMLRFMVGFTASQRHPLRAEKLVSKFLAGISRATGIWRSTRVRGLRRSPTGYNFLARK